MNIGEPTITQDIAQEINCSLWLDSVLNLLEACLHTRELFHTALHKAKTHSRLQALIRLSFYQGQQIIDVSNHTAVGNRFCRSTFIKLKNITISNQNKNYQLSLNIYQIKK